MDRPSRIRKVDTETVYDGWARLTRSSFELLRRDGHWQPQVREVFDSGHGVAILLYNIENRQVILTRQFRFPAHSAGYDEWLIEVPAGLLDGAPPEDRIRAEAEEETGYRVGKVKKVFEAFMSPGAFSQKNIAFVAPYAAEDRVSEGGGIASEGEDIEVLEVDFDDAMAMIEDGRIQDGKTIMLLQYAALHLFTA